MVPFWCLARPLILRALGFAWHPVDRRSPAQPDRATAWGHPSTPPPAGLVQQRPSGELQVCEATTGAVTGELAIYALWSALEAGITRPSGCSLPQNVDKLRRRDQLVGRDRAKGTAAPHDKGHRCGCCRVRSLEHRHPVALAEKEFDSCQEDGSVGVADRGAVVPRDARSAEDRPFGAGWCGVGQAHHAE
jgi:hypothetical protein